MFDVIAERFQAGGWGMYPIAVCSVLILAVAAERFYFLYFQASVAKDTFIQGVRNKILGGNLSSAQSLCDQHQVPLTRIVKSGLTKVNKTDAEVQAAMDESSLREMPQIERRTAYLAMLANVAMLAGLLGTISGLITSFGAVAQADASEKATKLAEGIAEAMNCTAFGLMTAIPGLVFFAILQGKTQQLLDDINEASVTVLNLVVTNRDKLDLSSMGPSRRA